MSNNNKLDVISFTYKPTVYKLIRFPFQQILDVVKLGSSSNKSQQKSQLLFPYTTHVGYICLTLTSIEQRVN